MGLPVVCGRLMLHGSDRSEAIDIAGGCLAFRRADEDGGSRVCGCVVSICWQRGLTK